MNLASNPPPHARHDLGRWGESLICDWYERRRIGAVVRKNVRLGALEIDVLIRQGNLLRVVEVRTSAHRSPDKLSWSLVGRKMKRLRKAMGRLARCPEYVRDSDHLVLDVALVYVDRTSRRVRVEVWFDVLSRTL